MSSYLNNALQFPRITRDDNVVTQSYISPPVISAQYAKMTVFFTALS